MAHQKALVAVPDVPPQTVLLFQALVFPRRPLPPAFRPVCSQTPAHRQTKAVAPPGLPCAAKKPRLPGLFFRTRRFGLPLLRLFSLRPRPVL